MPETTLVGIVRRAETGWPLDKVPYSQSGTYWNHDDQAWDDGYRPDCSGFASMCLGLATPGLSTVTLVTTGACKRITWAEMLPGDLVMLGGEGTWGNAGHVGVVVAVNRSAGTYSILHQGGGLGPDRWTGKIGSAVRAGMVPYRSAYVVSLSTQEDDMAMIVRHTDGSYWSLGADGVPHKLALKTAKGINDYGWVVSGRWGTSSGTPRPGWLGVYRNALIDREPWIEIPTAPIDVLAVAPEGAPVDPAALAKALAPLLDVDEAAIAAALAELLPDADQIADAVIAEIAS